jgi:hypothetical protein
MISNKYVLAGILTISVCIFSGCGTTRQDIGKGMQVGAAGSANPLSGIVFLTGSILTIGTEEKEVPKR